MAKLDMDGPLKLEEKTILKEIIQPMPGSFALGHLGSDRSFEVLGSSETIKTDFRLISATNKSLADMVQDASFREDLFYRINLITVRIPSLRERPEDIPHLVRFYTDNLKELYDRPDIKITSEAMDWLQEQSFPGNIRELKNLIERTVLMTTNNQLKVSDFKKYQEAFKKNND